MKLAAIICEYNPFHSGHMYHIEETKRLTDCDGIIAVMSGNFVQRGEAAVFDKKDRAKAAILCGADVVFELSAVHAVQTAELFARNALKIIASIPEIEYLSFGAECDDVSVLKKTALLLSEEKENYKTELKRLLDSGLSFPAARQQALILSGEEKAGEVLNYPNNILGVEYIKALIKYGSDIKPVLVKRKGAAHDSDEMCDGFFSASKLRAFLSDGDEELFKIGIPSLAFEVFRNSPKFDYDAFNRAVVANIIKMPVSELKCISGISEGLENRIKKAVLGVNSLDELLTAVKTKRYAHSSIRRIILSSYLGITEKERFTLPSYIKVLDYSEKGQKILNVIKKSSELPVIKNMKALKDADDEIKNIYEKEAELEYIYKLYRKPKGGV